MSAYHITMVSICAWFSVNTHALTMLIANRQLGAAARHRKPSRTNYCKAAQGEERRVSV